jgi:hypothetical protein
MSKPAGSTRKIDAAIAAAIACACAVTHEPPLERRSVYEDHDLIVIG